MKRFAPPVALLVLLAACGGSPASSGASPSPSPSPSQTASATPSGVSGTQVTAESGQRYGFNFTPQVLATSVGSTVTFTNASTASHTFTSDTPGQFDSGVIPPNGTFSHTFSAAGTYDFHCKIHSSMKATIQVS